MGSKISKARRSASAKTDGFIIPRVPQEIVDEILDHLAADSDPISLRSCSLVSRSWAQTCRKHNFYTVVFASKDTSKWLRAFPVPETGPAHFVRDLHFLAWGGFETTDKFLDYIPWFTNVEKVYLSGYGRLNPLYSILSLGTLPQSVTSLTINSDAITVTQIRDIMAQLPNLNDLSLSGTLLTRGRDTLLGIGTTLRGDFGGQLRLTKRQAHANVVNMLLEVPTGVHFTEVHILSEYECLYPAVRLSEACGENLVRLTYSVGAFGGERFVRSFDFSKLPNLQEVSLRLRWIRGSSHWIPAALSTLERVTSPFLSILQLGFTGPPADVPILETSIRELNNDLMRTAEEVTRIRCAYDEGIYVIVLRDQWFKEVLDTLKIKL